jgi:hypothetical protein
MIREPSAENLDAVIRPARDATATRNGLPEPCYVYHGDPGAQAVTDFLRELRMKLIERYANDARDA